MTTRVFAAAIAVCALGGAAAAQDFNRTVTAGKRSLIGQFALYSSDTCYSGAVPEPRTAKAPERGKLDFTMEGVVTTAGNCPPMRIYYRRVYYTPSPGFRGTEVISVDFIYNAFSDAPVRASRRQTYTVTVK